VICGDCTAVLAGTYYAVVEAMLKTGFTEEEISKVGGGNFCRVFDAATA
jgi:microsomal dipeptidase-like Zn-dependent dipeptidase